MLKRAESVAGGDGGPKFFQPGRILAQGFDDGFLDRLLHGLLELPAFPQRRGQHRQAFGQTDAPAFGLVDGIHCLAAKGQGVGGGLI